MSLLSVHYDWHWALASTFLFTRRLTEPCWVELKLHYINSLLLTSIMENFRIYISLHIITSKLECWLHVMKKNELQQQINELGEEVDECWDLMTCLVRSLLKFTVNWASSLWWNGVKWRKKNVKCVLKKVGELIEWTHQAWLLSLSIIAFKYRYY